MTETTNEEFAIKARAPGKKRFKFLTCHGGLNDLRIHAARFTEGSARVELVSLVNRNPDYDFKVVKL